MFCEKQLVPLLRKRQEKSTPTTSDIGALHYVTERTTMRRQLTVKHSSGVGVEGIAYYRA